MTDDKLSVDLLSSVMEVNSQGATKFVPERAAAWLCQEGQYITESGTGRIRFYDEDIGAWQPNGEERIKSLMEGRLAQYVNKHNLGETLGHIERRDYCALDRFNSRAGYINLRNGVYDIEERELKPHDPDLLFTYCLPIDYKADAKAPSFEKFLDEVTMGDAAMKQSILEGFAYSFIPGYPIQRANMLVGSGANGKSTLLSVLERFLGPDNCSHLTIQTISESRFAVEWLHGKLANISADLPKRGMKDAAIFKALTGGDTINAEVKRVQQPVRFSNSAKLWFSANVIPSMEEDTDAYFRRWNIWTFKNRFPEGEDVLPKLTIPGELSGIFNMVLEVLPGLIKNLRYTHSTDVETTRRNYIKSSDTVKLFCEESLTYDPESNLPKAQIYQAYLDFCKAENLIVVGKETAFWRKARMLVALQENVPTRGGERYVRGQRLVSTAPVAAVASIPFPSIAVTDSQQKLDIGKTIVAIDASASHAPLQDASEISTGHPYFDLPHHGGPSSPQESEDAQESQHGAKEDEVPRYSSAQKSAMHDKLDAHWKGESNRTADYHMILERFDPAERDLATYMINWMLRHGEFEEPRPNILKLR